MRRKQFPGELVREAEVAPPTTDCRYRRLDKTTRDREQITFPAAIWALV